jgi:hypothetical protein
MVLATSKNLTIVGIAGILATLAAVATALFDGDPATNPDWNTALLAVWNGIIAVMAKGSKSTGGSVPETQEAAARTMAPGFARVGLLLALAALCSAPLLARAQEPAPAPAVRFCFTDSCSYSLQTGLGFSGTFYTKGTDGGVEIARNVQLAGLAAIGTPWPVDPVVGPAWQTGTSQGWGATAGVAEKRSGVNGTILGSVLRVGDETTWAVGLGTLIRF